MLDVHVDMLCSFGGSVQFSFLHVSGSKLSRKMCQEIYLFDFVGATFCGIWQGAEGFVSEL